jgi:hypothetical protein
MTKIQYSSLINEIRGKISGSVLSVRKGVTYLKRHNQKQRQPHTADQQTVRGYLNNLTGLWYSLSDTKKQLWNSYAAQQKNPMTGLNSFNMLNLAICRYLNKTKIITSPPPIPSTPPIFMTFHVWTPGNGFWAVNWIPGDDRSITVISQYWALPGRDDNAIHRWKFGCCGSLFDGVCNFGTGLPEDTRIKFRVRTMDIYGRFSPWLYYNKFTKFQPGVYGSTAYGWCYYGP